MYRKADWRVALKSVNLIAMALVLSFVIGFYVIQFFAKPLIENSGFLEDERAYNRLPAKDQDDESNISMKTQLYDFFMKKATLKGTTWPWELHDYVEYLLNEDDSSGVRRNNTGMYPEKMQLREFFNENAVREEIPWSWDLHDDVEYIYGKDDHKEADDSCGRSTAGPKHSHFIGLFGTKAKEKSIIYIWSILLSQFVVSILIGVVLQLLWEDRAITEPL